MRSLHKSRIVELRERSSAYRSQVLTVSISEVSKGRARRRSEVSGVIAAAHRICLSLSGFMIRIKFEKRSDLTLAASCRRRWR
jgi:hypothetical protein